MGDFERTFGAGANIESIIDGFNMSYFCEQRDTERTMRSRGNKLDSQNSQTFSSFQEALAWAKANLGRAITRIPGGDGFMVKTPNSRS